MHQSSEVGFLLHPLALVILISSESLAKPDGAPAKACGKMTPKHWVNSSDNASGIIAPQTSEFPFAFEATKNQDGMAFTFTLKKGPFLGFLILVSKEKEGVGLPIGHFGGPDGNTKTMTCLPPAGRQRQVAENAITHKDKNEKNEITASWHPSPEMNTGKVYAKVTVAKNHDEFWVAKSFEVDLDAKPGSKPSGGERMMPSPLHGVLLLLLLLVAAVAAGILG